MISLPTLCSLVNFIAEYMLISYVPTLAHTWLDTCSEFCSLGLVLIILPGQVQNQRAGERMIDS